MSPIEHFFMGLFLGACLGYVFYEIRAAALSMKIDEDWLSVYPGDYVLFECKEFCHMYEPLSGRVELLSKDRTSILVSGTWYKLKEVRFLDKAEKASKEPSHA